MSKYMVYIGINIFLLVAGQGLWKIGIQKIGEFTIANIILSTYIWAGIILYALATFIWLKVLSIAPLSVAYPMQSLAYIFGMIMAYFLFGEIIPMTRWLGACVIFVGVILISL